MIDRENLKLSNQQWQEDDARWRDEIDQWEHEIQRLAALLYMLEKNLPEHTVSLDQHKSRIDEHNAELVQYYCGLDVNCRPDCPAHIDLDRQQELNLMMAERHQSVREAHDNFRTEYQDKMAKFRELAERLLSELN